MPGVESLLSVTTSSSEAGSPDVVHLSCVHHACSAAKSGSSGRLIVWWTPHEYQFLWGKVFLQGRRSAQKSYQQQAEGAGAPRSIPAHMLDRNANTSSPAPTVQLRSAGEQCSTSHCLLCWVYLLVSHPHCQTSIMNFPHSLPGEHTVVKLGADS